MLSDIGASTLDWLVRSFLSGRVSCYGPAAGEMIKKADVKYTAARKLENTITETQEHRYCCSHDHVMTEADLGNAFSAW